MPDTQLTEQQYKYYMDTIEQKTRKNKDQIIDLIHSAGNEDNDRAPDEFTCVLCDNLVYKPKQCSNCEQLICNTCIPNLNSKDCPSCGSRNNWESLPNKLRTILNKTQVWCHQKSCTLKMKQSIPYEKLEDHYKEECPQLKFKCPNGCKKDLRVASAEAAKLHIGVECKQAWIMCKQCNMAIQRQSEPQHLQEECVESKATCDECGETMKRKLLNEHVF